MQITGYLSIRGISRGYVTHGCPLWLSLSVDSRSCTRHSTKDNKSWNMPPRLEMGLAIMQGEYRKLSTLYSRAYIVHTRIYTLTRASIEYNISSSSAPFAHVRRDFQVFLSLFPTSVTASIIIHWNVKKFRFRLEISNLSKSHSSHGTRENSILLSPVFF